MGAKQSKRSVDISGKEAESAGEVAAAGAGGEGRMEALADADALKPQLNGEAHIEPALEITEKEKQLDSGTPENEKDATTEKENKEVQDDEKEAAPVVNGDGESKGDNGDLTPTPEDGKKPKKEKVKKKWSLRSISFSRKDKPKQEKKLKEEEPKVNGDAEKLPEEVAEATADAVENKVTEAVKSDTEGKEENSPETPETEPLTNGSRTPESPKAGTPVTEEPVAASPESERPDPPAEAKPDHLPVNGLSLEEPKETASEVVQTEDRRSEKMPAETTETAAAPEIPVKTEDPLPVPDKIADLIPEIPIVPELNSETLHETTSEVAVAD